MIEFILILLGIGIGLFIVYVSSPAPKTVIKYPTIIDADKNTYIDEIGQKYKYHVKEVLCDIK
jgi:hypothetical protein